MKYSDLGITVVLNLFLRLQRTKRSTISERRTIITRTLMVFSNLIHMTILTITQSPIPIQLHMTMITIKIKGATTPMSTMRDMIKVISIPTPMSTAMIMNMSMYITTKPTTTHSTRVYTLPTTTMDMPKVRHMSMIMSWRWTMSISMDTSTSMSIITTITSTHLKPLWESLKELSKSSHHWIDPWPFQSFLISMRNPTRPLVSHCALTQRYQDCSSLLLANSPKLYPLTAQQSSRPTTSSSKMPLLRIRSSKSSQFHENLQDRFLMFTLCSSYEESCTVQ